jgi:site-specific DNA recombinase
MKIALYLRKSRADEELEKTLGQGETLSKHRRALLKFAKERQFNIVEIKEEIVSGESLFHRPKMLELLKEVEGKLYEGVLVMDIQRLGRGDMQDQGLILKTFKDSNTKIITPQKTYDLSNDFDEEYSEFEAFMSRKELKMINRRMQGGRIRSVEDGNYLGTNPPIGYDIDFIGKARTLKPNAQADIVKMIFDMYINGKGSGTIAEELNSLGYRSANGKMFERTSICFIIKNPIYIGKLTWKKKESKKSMIEGKKRDSKTRAKKDWIIVSGKHKGLIEESVFHAAQEIINGKYHVPYQLVNGIANPLAGIVICGICGSKMVLRKYGANNSHIICNKKCGCTSARFDYVEKAILDGLEKYYNEFKIAIGDNRIKDNTKVYEMQIEMISKELETLNNQKLKLFDLLEQGTYDNKTFLERSNNISERMDTNLKQIENLKAIINKEKISKDITKEIKSLLDVYDAADIALKNKLLKKVLLKVEYKKIKPQRNDDFVISLFPRV